MDTLIFDIETIPQSTLSTAQENALKTKVERATKNSTDKSEYDGIRNKIMAISPFFGQIICIGVMKIKETGEEIARVLEGDEKTMLETWWNVLKHHKGLFVHYNGLGFDVPYIIKRSMYHNIMPTNSQFLDTRRFQKFPHFDVFQVICDYDMRNAVSLDVASEYLGIKSPKTGEVKAENVYQAYQDGRMKEIAEYCLDDVRATYDVYKRVKDYTFQPKQRW
jgi:3'-5' exonuclease